VSETAERRYHHGNRRAALLARAETVRREEGAGALSLRELARDVGVSHGAPRRHFADKQALLDALAVVGFTRLGETLAAADPGTGAFPARTGAVARAYVGFATREANLLDVMFAAKHTTPDPTVIAAAADRAFLPVLALITDGQAAGALAPGDPEDFGVALFATLQGLAALANRGMLADATLDERVDDAVARLLRGSAPR
jgi:AcrR family transcriptional regulator